MNRWNDAACGDKGRHLARLNEVKLNRKKVVAAERDHGTGADVQSFKQSHKVAGDLTPKVRRFWHGVRLAETCTDRGDDLKAHGLGFRFRTGRPAGKPKIHMQIKDRRPVRVPKDQIVQAAPVRTAERLKGARL